MNNDILYDTNIINDVFAVTVPKTFITLQEQLTYALTDTGYKKDASKYTNEDLTTDRMINDLPDDVKVILGLTGTSPIPTEYLKQGKRRDTSLGGNDAINCYPQFHEDDDIVPLINALDDTGDRGLGRVYEEKIDRNQQILWCTFGVLKFTDIATFYSTAIDSGLSKLMNKGDDYTAWDIGNIAGSIVGFVATLPLQPFIFMSKLINGLFKGKATRYFEFKPAMPLYYRIVNTQIAELIVDMGISRTEKDYETETSITNTIFSNVSTSNITEQDQNGRILNNNPPKKDALPELFSTYGLDILHILRKRELYDSGKNVSSLKSLNDYLKELKSYNTKSHSFTKEIMSGFLSGTYESLSFIGLRLEKSDNSESLSNTVALPSIANTVNAHSKNVRDKLNSSADFNLIGGKTGTLLKNVKQAVTGFVSGTLGSVGMSGIFGLITGQGLVDFPEAWTDSSFTKSYSFNVKLKAISGDKVSLAYRYIIMMMLLAAALPRAVGRNAYTSPFIVRAYAKGMIGIPLGIIDSIQIKRGESEYGWSVDHLPLSISVSFTIKDLSPNMFLTLSDSTSWTDILGQNTNWNEYIATLSGLSLKERLLMSDNIKRRAKILTTLARTTKFNPLLWGFRLSNNTSIGNLAIAVSPISKLPTR